MANESIRVNEDWLAVWTGLLVFVLSLALITGTDLLGWVVTTSVWTDATKALAPASKSDAGVGGSGALIATCVALVTVMTLNAATLGADVRRFAIAQPHLSSKASS